MSDRISTVSRSTLRENQYKRPRLLPLIEDVVKLSGKIEEKLSEMTQDINSYVDIVQLTLAQVILFNRRRSGEAERMKLSDYETAVKNKTEPSMEVQKSLSKFEVHLCKSHTRVETKGKRGRRVPVHLTRRMLAAIQALIMKRELVGVQSDFLFARPGVAAMPYRGHDCLRRYAKECGANRPELMTSTNLRKQLATVCQVLSLSENSQDILANFLGHDIRVHHSFYRLPDNLLEAAKVTKVLHAINEGEIAKWKDKDFDEIDFDPEG